jgi:hypothetical protein
LESGAAFGVSDHSFRDEDFTEHRTVWRGRLHDLAEAAEQFAQLVSARLTLANISQHAAKLIERVQKDVHRTAIGSALAFAHEVQNLFGLVSQLNDLREPHESGCAFDGMKGAEDAIQEFRVVGSGFERNEILVELREQVVAFRQKILQESGVLREFL